MSPRYTIPEEQTRTRDLLRIRANPVGRLWGCRNPTLENAEVYLLQGRAYFVTPIFVACLDYTEFLRIVRENREFFLQVFSPLTVG